MRLSVLPVLLAGAGLAHQVAAEPIRVIVGHQDLSDSKANANIRFGHALANANVNGNDDNVASIIRPAVIMSSSTEVSSKGRHFCGSSWKAKAIKMSNSFRHALGLPLIEIKESHSSHQPAHHKSDSDNRISHSDGVHILPMPFLGAPPSVTAPVQETDEANLKEMMNEGGVVRVYRHGHVRPKHHHRGSFMKRIHRALMALGPWEGRAVAFVLGCGIGVLFRMVWVLMVLTYRTIRGEREEDDTLEHEYIVFEEDAENVYVPPPQYTDEKVREAEFEEEAETEVRV
ncbi:hypothetical protein SERLA73DRAFT_180938 [Serpula lacrymans var. lacrymans S7.3]|uniref:Protein BIG1 n=2 Tax=Serpula lacrymans var. lacrymans TaxID=341189 RepID=F8PWN9_SERL3|nr:uncharacterized protein SERLADRAFT_466770 [Serpula lacrymans var. lacrymans S7.9]EGO00363.1 hypothetical protein SERLA73DRAFT_180938 [Serpula lacrymans var. lacrymans S7.3]EGO25925.1 hypothetical protein SERLADRAFT_466770 [Serpula lacrymans var. lacrymans S7.9]